MDDKTFRQAYPQFSDLIAVPPDAVAFWLGVGIARLDVRRWANLLDEGLALFVAHKVALGMIAAQGGGSGGVVSSKSVGGVSIAYNTELGTEEGGGS